MKCLYSRYTVLLASLGRRSVAIFFYNARYKAQLAKHDDVAIADFKKNILQHFVNL